MSDQESLEAIETLELATNVDDNRPASHPFKLPAAGATSLRSVAFARLTTLKSACATTALESGAEVGSQVRYRRVLRNLQNAHRAGQRHLLGLIPDFIPPATGQPPNISDEMRAQLLESYGFAGGISGDQTDARIMDLARQASVAAGVAVENPAWHYPITLLQYIDAQLVEADEAQTGAVGGSTTTAIEARNIARELAVDIIARVRFHYCSASDDGDRTVELRRIGMQPRRLSGDAQPAPLPDATGPVTHDATEHTLSVAALPPHATSLRAYRQVLGGVKVLAGTSTTTTVSYAEATPLEPNAQYEVWLAGHNSEGDGPISEKFTVTG